MQMTPQEIAEWLGFPDREPIVALVQGMAHVKVPVTDREHINAFRAFLKCVPFSPRKGNLFKS